MSMNERERCSHWKRKQELDHIITLIGWLTKQHKIPPATQRRYVNITIHKSLRSRVMDDPANLHARAKAPLDALVRLHLLTDDNHAGLEWGGVIEGPRERMTRTTILLTDLSKDQLIDDAINAITGDAA